MKTSNFSQTLAVGKLAESYVLRLLNGCGLKAAPVAFAQRSFWDVQAEVPNWWGLEDNLLKLEVKHDIYHARTGNIAIEVFNTVSNKPSGLTNTKADLWVCVLHDSMWIAKTEFLKTFVFDAGIKPKKIVDNAGDGNAMIYLYSDDEILSIFHRVDNLISTEVLEKLKELCKKH